MSVTNDRTLLMNTLKTFIRVETCCKELQLRKGAYAANLADISKIYSNGYPEYIQGVDRWPGPYNDAGLVGWWEDNHDETCKSYIFGFATPSHYLNWFLDVEGRTDMREAGGVLGVYLIPDTAIVEGQFQAIAHKATLVHLGDLPLDLTEDEYKLQLQELRDEYTKETS